jgi:hypothetical protein
MLRRSPVISFAILLLILSAPLRAAGDAALAVDAAYARLAAMPYRKRETVLGPAAAAGGMRPIVTDVIGNRTRMSYEIDVPGMGTVRSECVTIGQRRAVRTVAPGLVAAIEKAKQKATVSSVRSLLNQIASVAVAMQTGGLSSGAMIHEAIRAGATMKSAVDARRVLDQAARAFDSWQLVSPDEDDGAFEFAGGGGVESPASDGMIVSFVSVVRPGMARSISTSDGPP